MVFMGHGFTSGGQSQGLCLAQLCAKYRLVSATLSPYHQCKKAASLKTSCLLVAHLPSGSRTLNYLYTIYIVYDTLVLLRCIMETCIHCMKQAT